MKATLVVSTVLGLTAAHVMPRGGGNYASDSVTSNKVSISTTAVPLSTGVSYPDGNGDDDEYCDDDEDDSGDDNDDDDSWPTIPVPQTTSTVTTTSVYTVTACPKTVTDCPVGHVTTEVVTDYTTYCPAPTGELTKYSTLMVTITECPETVTNCPARTTATVSSCVYTPVPTEETVYTTVTLPTCSGAWGGNGCYETHSEVKTSWYYAPPTTPVHATETAWPTKTAGPGWGNSYGTGTGYHVPTTVATTYAYGGTGSAPVPTYPAGQPATTTYPVTAGVGKVGFSAVAIIAGVAAFVL